MSLARTEVERAVCLAAGISGGRPSLARALCPVVSSAKYRKRCRPTPDHLKDVMSFGERVVVPQGDQAVPTDSASEIISLKPFTVAASTDGHPLALPRTSCPAPEITNRSRLAW